MKGATDMFRISISQISRVPSGEVPELLAQFSVDSDGIHPEKGERTDVVATIPVIDPESGDRVLSSEDPVRWAHLLPLAFRSGDLAIQVQEVEFADTSIQEVSDPAQTLAQKAGDEALAGVDYAF
jgi:hypothetical protein